MAQYSISKPFAFRLLDRCARLRRCVLFALLLALPLAGLLGALGLTLPTPALAEPLVRELTIGQSGQGRPISAVQIGNGPRKLVVVGDTHGGPEANTYDLTVQLIDYFRANPQQVPPGVRLYLIPSLNPDGLALGSRFNAATVDLNRNMNTNLDACPDNDWQSTVYGAGGLISDTGGPYPDSEPESRLIRGFLLDASGAIFLHSNAGMVFPAACEHAPSIRMAEIYAQAAGYLYTRFWPRYPINGGMHDWAASLGIAAITPELISPTDSEFAQNLAGVQAVLAQADAVLPLPEDQLVGGVPVPALIWRYWRAHGGEQLFGVPLEPARATALGLAQTFTNGRIEVDRTRADTPVLVQPATLGRERLQLAGYRGEGEAACMIAPCTLFPETGHTLREGFLDYWQRNGGVEVFGYPLSEEFSATSADGQMRIVQYFERAVLAYIPEDGSIRPEPIGWQALQQQQVRAPWVAAQVR